MQNNKSQNEIYLRTQGSKEKIKIIREKSSFLNRKKIESKVFQSENNLIKSIINKNQTDESSNNKTIKWDYISMIQNIQYCPIPRFLIVEVIVFKLI